MNSVWRSRGVEHSLNAVAVPTLSVGGYYDQEDMYGPQIEYSMLEPPRPKPPELPRPRPLAPRLLVLVLAPPGQPRLQ